MDMIMNCFFDDVFRQLDRGYLMRRYKRKELIDYLSNVISACVSAEGSDPGLTCEEAVLSALRLHGATRDSNGAVCLMGKYHNVLYIAAKLCFDFRVQTSETVSHLLKHMHMCEGSFERLFAGVIYGIRVSHLLAGWKTDFGCRKENMEAIAYFLDHSTKSKSEYGKDRFLEVPLVSYGRISPAGACLLNPSPDLLLILLRFGAAVEVKQNIYRPPPCFQLISKMNEYHLKGERPPKVMNQCLVLVLRVVPTVEDLVRSENTPNEYATIEKDFIDKYIPDTKSGKTTPELKHLCRLSLRQSLNDNFQLPYGINELPLPESIKDYLNITFD